MVTLTAANVGLTANCNGNHHLGWYMHSMIIGLVPHCIKGNKGTSLFFLISQQGPFHSERLLET